MDLQAGSMLGRYRLLERAGEGGMAEVWRAVQPRLDRIVAIKVLPRHLAVDPDYLERFQREARAISRLDHRNILGIYDFGEDDGITYMVMPYVSGGTLERRMGQPWNVPGAVQLLEPLASALDYAHANGVIHRDVKPSNVLIAEDGRVVLADFGIARMTEGTQTLSLAGALLGTPAYMSPEQVQGPRVTPATDQYSLGIVAYEMLTGRRPFTDETPLAVALAHLHRPLPPPRTINPGIPTDVERVIFKVLAKDPEDRYPSVTAFVEALSEADRAALTEPVAVPTPTHSTDTSTTALVTPPPPLPAHPSTPIPSSSLTLIQPSSPHGPPNSSADPETQEQPPADSPSGRRLPGRWAGAVLACLVIVVGLVLATQLIPLTSAVRPVIPPTGTAIPATNTQVAVATSPTPVATATPLVSLRIGRVRTTMGTGAPLRPTPSVSLQVRPLQTLSPGDALDILGLEEFETELGTTVFWWQVRTRRAPVQTGWLLSAEVE